MRCGSENMDIKQRTAVGLENVLPAYDRHSLLLGFYGRFDGLVHLAVAGAAAEIAAEGLANFCIGRIGIGRQQMCDRHHEAGGAEAALSPAPVAVSFLDCSESAVFGDAFDAGDLLPFATRG